MRSERRKFRIVLPFAILFTTLAVVSLGCVSGTPPEETWNKTFGGYSAEHAPSAQQTSDGGYILVGDTMSYGAGESDFWLVKTDSEGNKEWDRTFGGTGLEWAYSVQQTSDGGYILVGGTRSYGAGESDFWLVKTDSNGNKEWDRTYGGTKSDSARSVQQTSDGGYILVGGTRSYGAGSNDVWLVKTDSGGNMEWDRIFGGTDSEWVYSVQQTSDNGYILAGVTGSYGAAGYNFWLVKTDLEGNKEWDKTFGGNSDDCAESVQQTSDGGYILAGGTMSYGADGYNFWLVKTDSEGDKEWDKTFGGTDSEWARSVQQTSDGGYILAGDTVSYGAGDFWLVKTDLEGNKEWDKTFGGTDDDRACFVQQTSDGGYILVGDTVSYGAGLRNVWLIKVGGTDAAPPPAKATELAETSTPAQIPTSEQKDKTTQTIEFVGGVIFLAAIALLAGMLVVKFHKKRREEPKHDDRKHETHKKSAGSVKDDTRPYYYKVLDVNTDASQDEIKKAYRRLSMLYHPDTSTDPDAEKKMKEINKAYDVLSNPDKRARYDNFENTFKG